MTGIDVAAVRADTPGTHHVAHLNNAGSSLPPAPVIAAVDEYLRTESLIGGYETVDERSDDLNHVYTAASQLLGGAPANWAFVESATRAWNAAFSSLLFAEGDRVITTKAEYSSNMFGLLRARERYGVEIVVAPDDEHGQVDVSALANLLDDRTRLVSVCHVPTQGGLINPATEVGALLRSTNILYQLDACQSVGQLPVNVDDIGCDILSFTGRKFARGPRGTGMVWASDAALDQMSLPAGADGWGVLWQGPFETEPEPGARRFEPYEIHFAGKVGLGVALDYARTIGLEAIAARNAELAGYLRNQLLGVNGITVHDKGLQKAALVTFAVAGLEAAEVKNALRAEQINTSVTALKSAMLDFPDRGLGDIVRSSVHYFNTTEEIDRLVAVVDGLASR